jgi:hypothetical protein
MAPPDSARFCQVRPCAPGLPGFPQGLQHPHDVVSVSIDRVSEVEAAAAAQRIREVGPKYNCLVRRKDAQSCCTQQPDPANRPE